MLPAVKRDKLKQGSQILEESSPGGCRESNCAVRLIQPLKCGMGEESQQVEGSQKVRQVLFAMGKVMLEMVAVVLEDIVVFVLNFPTGAACGDDLHDIMLVNGVRCGPRIAVDNLLFGIGEGDPAPVYQQGIIAIA